jgi:hypothetical protein
MFLVVLAASAVVRPELIPWLIRISVVWNIQHWVAQSYGLGLIYIARSGFPLTRAERQSLWLACQLLILLAVTRVLAYPHLEVRDFCGIDVPPIAFISVEVQSYLSSASYAVLTLLSLFLTVRFVKQRKCPPLAVFALYATIFKVTLTSYGNFLYLWLFGLPFFHALQYLAITTTYHVNERESALASDEPATLMSPVARDYYLKLFFASVVLYTATPWLLQKMGIPAPNAMALFILIINFHHVFSDAFIWKLKDPQVRQFLK